MRTCHHESDAPRSCPQVDCAACVVTSASRKTRGTVTAYSCTIYTVLSESIEFQPNEFSHFIDWAWWERESCAKEKAKGPSDRNAGPPPGR